MESTCIASWPSVCWGGLSEKERRYITEMGINSTTEGQICKSLEASRNTGRSIARDGTRAVGIVTGLAEYLGLVTALVILVLALGCASRQVTSSPPYKPEQGARDAIVSARAFLARAQQNHLSECSAGCEAPTVKDKSKCIRICNAINAAVDMHNVAVAAMNAFCASAEWEQGGVCMGDPAKKPALDRAITNLNGAVEDARKAGGGR